MSNIMIITVNYLNFISTFLLVPWPLADFWIEQERLSGSTDLIFYSNALHIGHAIF